MAKPFYSFSANKNDLTLLPHQITNSFMKAIDNGEIAITDQLPTINKFSKEYCVARNTIEKAYGRLRKLGCIKSVPGKGYYLTGRKSGHLEVLLIFNKLSSYKKIVYDSFINALESKVKVDLKIHHYNAGQLKEIIDKHLGRYHYYVIMPHFHHSIKKANTFHYLKKSLLMN